MRNPVSSGRIIAIWRIVLTLGFDGATAAAQVSAGFRRFTGASPTAGTSPSRIKTSSKMATSVVTDASIKEGALLTLAAAFEGYAHEIAVPVTGGSILSHVLDLDLAPFMLETGEGIAIGNPLVAVIGACISGSVWWSETLP